MNTVKGRSGYHEAGRHETDMETGRTYLWEFAYIRSIYKKNSVALSPQANYTD
jgi:hypothetical protein